MRELLFISQDREMALIQEMTYKIQVSNFDIHPDKTCFLCVSPDYSGIAAQHLSHALSNDREIYCIEAVNVPFPGEDPKPFQDSFREAYEKLHEKWENFVLIEAGVIRGSNYSWITKTMKDVAPNKYYTVSLCENTGSKYKSDLVSLYYDDVRQDLHFWWEKPNKHWST